MNKKKIISYYHSKNGGLIILTAETKKHLKVHPETTPGLLREAIGKITLPKNGKLLLKEVDFARIIGYSGKAATSPIKFHTENLFAIRTGRVRPSRVVITNKRKIRKMVLIASPADKENKIYKLITAYIGTRAPKEPWDSTISGSKEFKKSLKFWCRNALIYDSKVMGKPFKSSWKKVIQEIKRK